MKWVALALALAACGAPPPPSSAPKAEVRLPEPVPAKAAAERTPAPTAISRMVAVGPKTALVPDPACLDRPLEERRFLGFRSLPDVELEATFWLVSGQGVCKVTTHGRVELLLAKSRSLEQNATCQAWRVEPCEGPPLLLAVPSPAFREVKELARAPGWHEMDTQSDGLGQARRDVYVTRIPGSSLALMFTRSGAVVLLSGEKKLDAFWGQMSVFVDGVPYLVTPDSLVRLADPPEHRELPSLYMSEEPPYPKAQPWERQN